MKKSKENYAYLGHVPIGKGFILKGWDIREENFRSSNILPVVDFRAMTEKCPRDCNFCFTDKNKKTLTLKEIKRVISEITKMGTRGIDFLGEGEPTIDKDFFEIVEFTSSLGVIPVVFTEAATKLRNRDFVRRLKASGASVVPKCDSMLNSQYQNEVVKDKTGKYFDQRNKAVELLIGEGFNEINLDGTTRLGFDMVISNQNINEVENMLMVCRQQNIFVVFSTYLPSGRVIKDGFDKSFCPSAHQIVEMKNKIANIDEFFGLRHQIFSNFSTFGCIERLQIYGDGRVSPCPGNETVIGMVQNYSIKELNQMILSKFPAHNPCSFNGNCIYHR